MVDTSCMTKWVDALRSGEYQQTRGFLCTDEGYCCLGVLETACFNETFASLATGVPVVGVYKDSYGRIYNLPTYRAEATNLRKQASDREQCSAAILVRKYSGGALPLAPTRQEVLTHLNDALVPFDKIADYIEDMGWTKEVINDG